jgi:hypothetical protein
LLFLLFLIIDLVVASVLTSMGMMILPPVVVSLPFKLIFFCSDRRLDAGRRLAHTKLRNIEWPRRRTMLFRTISPVSHRRYSWWNDLELLSVVGLTTVEEDVMGFGRGLLLWLIGIPLPIIILLAIFMHH